MATIYKEIWAADLAGNLFPDNSFLSLAIDDSDFVEGKTVHLPQGGAKPTVVVDRSSFPGSITERTDTIVDYTLRSFSTDPTLIRNVDELEISYDKRQSVMFDHQESLKSEIADRIIYEWAPNIDAQQVRTTGAARTAIVAGATGNRKTITLADVLKAKRILDNQEIPQEGRVLLLPADMYNDLLAIDEIIWAAAYGDALPKGAIGMLFGFAVYIRSKVARYTNAATPLPVLPSAAVVATHNAAALFFHPKFVRRALGEVKPFFQEDAPEYYGDILSFEAIAGGSRRYDNYRGIVALIEDAAA